MVHLLVFRSCNSFIQSKDTLYGQHERIEFAINNRKYHLNKSRKGYNIPHASEWKIIEYRVKKEAIPSFVRDLEARVINPVNNNVKLRHWLFMKQNFLSESTVVTIGRSLLFIQWLFKWFTKFNNLFKFLPLLPVPVGDGVPEPFTTGWHNTFVIGMLPDVDRGRGEEL